MKSHRRISLWISTVFVLPVGLSFLVSPWSPVIRFVQAADRVLSSEPSRVLQQNLSGLIENDLFHEDGAAKLWAVVPPAKEWNQNATPLILIHGTSADPMDLQALVDRFIQGPYQIYVLAYEDRERKISQSASELVEELLWLRDSILGRGRDLTLIAHSMGGLLTRAALNELAESDEAPSLISHFGRIRFYALDTPWHGFPGPSDEGFFRRKFMGFVGLFMPGALYDMRAGSYFFEDLFSVPLPSPQVAITIVSAREGKYIQDYSRGNLTKLPGLLNELLESNPAQEIKEDPRLLNYWAALRSSRVFRDFDREARRELAADRLDRAKALELLQKYFPQFPGNHEGILKEQAEQPNLIDYLSKELGIPTP